MIIWLHQRWKWCLEFVGCERSTRRICFYRLSCMLQVWHKLIWEKAITKKRITILMKVTKIKTSLLSLTLEPGNESLVRSIMFLLSEKTRTQNKIWRGFNNNLDFADCSHEYQELSGESRRDRGGWTVCNVYWLFNKPFALGHISKNVT